MVLEAWEQVIIPTKVVLSKIIAFPWKGMMIGFKQGFPFIYKQNGWAGLGIGRQLVLVEADFACDL